MPTLIERAMRTLKVGLDAASATEVEYRAEGKSIEDLKAVPGRTDFEQYTLDDMIGTAKAFDWIVSEQDLRIGTVKVEPQSGHEIVYTLGDGRKAYYLVVPTANSRCYDVVDQLGILYRIHTKLDRIEPRA